MRAIALSLLLVFVTAETDEERKKFEQQTEEFRDFLEQTTRNQHEGAPDPDDPIDFSLLGKEGVNYEMNGTNPYITCDYLNVTECDPTKRDDCRKTIDCYLLEGQPIISCLAVFQYHPTEEEVGNKAKLLDVPNNTIALLGCMWFKRDGAHYCDNQCTALTSVPSGTRREGDDENTPPGPGYGWCCCHTKNCNGQGRIKTPNPHFPHYIEPNEKKKEESNHLYILMYSLLTVSTVILVILLSYSGMAFYKWLKPRFEPVGNQAEVALAPLVQNDDDTDKENSFLDQGGYNEDENLLKIELTSQEMVSRGRYGSVWRSKMDVNGVPMFVAVKKHRAKDLQSYIAEKAIFEELLTLPSWYPGVLKYFGHQKMGSEYWIITEFHERLSLFDLIKDNVISVASALRIIVSMLDGLQFLHDERPYYFGHPKPAIIHRDIKSQNVLIRSDMTACIADFGLAIKIGEGVLRKKNDLLGQVGTRRYMSPEVLEGATEFTLAAFKQMDVYAMALVIWETLWRTKATDWDIVPPYQQPYEEHVGKRPQLGQMRAVVVVKNLRPNFRPAHEENPKTNIIMNAVKEMWDTLSDARLTAGCAFQRALKISFEPSDYSEGYHSDIRRGEDYMLDYHKHPDTPHPTQDPFRHEPKPPLVPDLESKKNEAAQRVVEEPTEVARRDMVYDLDRQALVSARELGHSSISIDSTPTPTDLSEASD